MIQNIFISGQNIKPYIKSMLGCRITGTGFVLEPLNSKFVLDFNSFQGKIKCIIDIKRLNGNGKLILESNNEIKNHDIHSKTSHKIELELNDNKIIEFKRNNESSGKILICNFDITLLEPLNADTPLINPHDQKWNDIFSKCGIVRGITIFDGKCLCSEGASIQRGDIINNIQTDPIQNYTNSNNTIKFINPCEILEIYFKSDDELYNQPKFSYPHLVAPPKIVAEPYLFEETADPITTEILSKVKTITNKTSAAILYDSFKHGLHPGILSNAHDITSGVGKNGKGAILNRLATFSVPIAALEPNKQYIVVLNIKKINGNGKLWVSFATTDNSSRESVIIISPDRNTERYIKLHTNEPPSPGNTYVLKIYRDAQASVGEVLLDRVMVIQGIITSCQLENAQKYSSQNNQSNSNTQGYNFSVEDDDIIKMTVKKYSRYNYYKSDITLNYSGNLTVTNSSALNWYNKVRPVCSNLNTNPANTEGIKVLFGQIGSLMPAEKIWLDVFDENIPENDHNILNNAKVIISPSFQNTELLRKKYPNATIHHLERAWPIIKPVEIQFLKQDYIIMIHRNNYITKRIIESYNLNNPKLLIVGYRGSLPNNIIGMNEYVSYDKFLFAILNSRLVLDIPIFDDYYSAYLSIAKSAGIPILTSNWFALREDNAKFMLCQDRTNKIAVPTVNDFNVAVNDALELKKEIKDISKHNEKFERLLQILF